MGADTKTQIGLLSINFPMCSQRQKCNNIVPTKGKFMDVSIIATGNSKGKAIESAARKI